MGEPSLWERLTTSLRASAGEVVFGMEDGTVSIFGLVFGVAATTSDQKAVLIAGASGAVAAAVSMMAGTFLDAETNEDQTKVQASHIKSEVRSETAVVLEGVTQRLQAVGLAHEQATIVSDFLASQPAILQGFATALATPEEPMRGKARWCARCGCCWPIFSPPPYRSCRSAFFPSRKAAWFRRSSPRCC